MALSPTLLAQLEAHGVTSAHLEALLRLVACNANGSFVWHWHQGKLAQCEARLVFSSQTEAVDMVSQTLCGVDT
jgi:hypothetical protein